MPNTARWAATITLTATAVCGPLTGTALAAPSQNDALYAPSSLVLTVAHGEYAAQAARRTRGHPDLCADRLGDPPGRGVGLRGTAGRRR